MSIDNSTAACILISKPEEGFDMEKKTSAAQLKAIAKYDAAHTVQLHLKLNTDTDSDILKQLDKVQSKQGYIKALIREDMRKE